MPKALSNSQLMNQIIRRGKTPQPQQEEATELSPETVIADVKALVDELPERELEPFVTRYSPCCTPRLIPAG